MSTGAAPWSGDGKMAAIDSVTFRARAVGGQVTLNGWCSILQQQCRTVINWND